MNFFYSSSEGTFNSSEKSQKEGYNILLERSQTAFDAKLFFTSSLTIDTDTGILKALALRMSTSLQCQDIMHAEFPFDCNETSSLAMNFTNTQFQGGGGGGGNYSRKSYYIAPIFSFHICSPGGANNWARDNDSSHTIREELYMDLQTWRSSATEDSWQGLASNVPIRYNFTYHCIADSKLGYFEPMNK